MLPRDTCSHDQLVVLPRMLWSTTIGRRGAGRGCFWAQKLLSQQQPHGGLQVYQYSWHVNCNSRYHNMNCPCVRQSRVLLVGYIRPHQQRIYAAHALRPNLCNSTRLQKSSRLHAMPTLTPQEEVQTANQEQTTAMPAGPLGGQTGRRPWWHVDEGVPVALTVLAAWGYMINYTCFHVELGTLQSALLFLPMMQLHTGVFITAHEAMHGSVAPSNPWLNDAIGRLAGTLYAGLDFTYMRQKHREHHAHTGLVGEDPDFHPGTGRDLGPWAWNFMKRYLSFWQFVRLNVMVGAIQLSGAPYLNMVVFLLCAGLLSAVQLFYFGTYVPHRPPKDSPHEVMNWEKAQTSAAKTRLGSFLTCYSFDCHYEHHANPRTPWFRLWDDRKARLAGMADKLIK